MRLASQEPQATKGGLGFSPEKTTDLLGGIAKSLEEFAASIRSHAEQYELAEVENRKARDLFVGMVAHELRTPVVALRSRLELLAKEVGTTDGHKMVEQLLESCDDLVQISSDLLDFQKIEAGALSLHMGPFIPRVLLTRITEDQHAISESLKTQFDLRIDGKASEWRMGDRYRLLQILSNVLGNAQKFSDGAEVKLIADFRSSDSVAFTIADSGPGMTPEELSTIFHPYRQLAQGQSSALLGTGLGLVVVQHLVDLMDGEIEVESTPGIGTSFKITLPLAVCPAPDQTTEQTRRLHQDLSLDLTGKVLLHVDDDKLQGDLLVELLRRTGVRMLRASSVEAAMAILARRPCDFLISDLYMQDGTGLEVVGQLRRLQNQGRQGQAKVLLVSASIPDHVRQSLEDLSVDLVVTKPLRKKTLFEFLSEPSGNVAHP